MRNTSSFKWWFISTVMLVFRGGYAPTKMGHIWTCWTMATLLQPLGSDKLWTSPSQTILDEGIFGKYLNRSPTKMQPTIHVVIDNNFMTWSAGGSGKRFTIDISVIWSWDSTPPQLHHQRTVTIHSTTTPPHHQKTHGNLRAPMAIPGPLRPTSAKGEDVGKKNTMQTYQWYT